MFLLLVDGSSLSLAPSTHGLSGPEVLVDDSLTLLGSVSVGAAPPELKTGSVSSSGWWAPSARAASVRWRWLLSVVALVVARDEFSLLEAMVGGRALRARTSITVAPVAADEAEAEAEEGGRVEEATDRDELCAGVLALGVAWAPRPLATDGGCCSELMLPSEDKLLIRSRILAKNRDDEPREMGDTGDLGPLDVWVFVRLPMLPTLEVMMVPMLPIISW